MKYWQVELRKKKLLSLALNDLICSVLARGFATYISRFGHSPIFGLQVFSYIRENE